MIPRIGPIAAALLMGGCGPIAAQALPLRAVYQREIGVREATGQNDGPRVEAYLASCGLGAGHPWCAAFVAWCHQQAGLPAPSAPAWSPSWFPRGRTIWTRASGQPPRGWRAGDLFGIYYPERGRVAHVGFVDSLTRSGWVITVEGNTSPDGRRDGQGVHRRRRRAQNLHAVSRWAP